MYYRENAIKHLKKNKETLHIKTALLLETIQMKASQFFIAPSSQRDSHLERLGRGKIKFNFGGDTIFREPYHYYI